MTSSFFFPHKYNRYNESRLDEEHEEHCSHDKTSRIFFEGSIKMLKQEWNGAIYVLKDDDCIIKVPNMTHLRLTGFPYPEYFEILAPVFDITLFGKRKIIQIKSGWVPKTYISLNLIDYYLEMKRMYG